MVNEKMLSCITLTVFYEKGEQCEWLVFHTFYLCNLYHSIIQGINCVNVFKSHQSQN